MLVSLLMQELEIKSTSQPKVHATGDTLLFFRVQEREHMVSNGTVRVCDECGGTLGTLTRLECPLQSEDFGVGSVFIGASWQEEAGTRSRITEQQWNAVQRGIS